MKNQGWAIGNGDVFGFLTQEEFDEILLDYQGSVRFEGEYWNLFHGKHEQDKEKIEHLLKQHTVYSVKEHQVFPVQMTGVLEMEIPEFNKDRDSILFGAYTFICDEKTIPVDFSGMSWNTEQVSDRVLISFTSGETPFGKNYFLEDYYEEDYAEAGLRFNDITAEFLSHADAISEFMVGVEMHGGNEWGELGPEEISKLGCFTLKELSFSDREHNYPVRQEVLDAFNQSLLEPELVEDHVMSFKMWDRVSISGMRDVCGLGTVNSLPEKGHVWVNFDNLDGKKHVWANCPLDMIQKEEVETTKIYIDQECMADDRMVFFEVPYEKADEIFSFLDSTCSASYTVEDFQEEAEELSNGTHYLDMLWDEECEVRVDTEEFKALIEKLQSTKESSLDYKIRKAEKKCDALNKGDNKKTKELEI